jgi:CRISPR-associated protein (TIGR03984 family)
MACEPLILDGLDRTWLGTKAAEFADPVLLLIEGYEWTGFARWKEGKFEFPPGADFGWSFSEMWDLRLFSATGEWHCWKTGDGVWLARFANAADWKDYEARDYVLWGRQDPISEGEWTVLREANGVSLYVPIAVRGSLKNRPVRLTAWLAAAYDNAGQAYIADAMLRKLHQEAE